MTRAFSALRSFGLFWWDFVVGEDWRIAVGVVIGLAGTAALASRAVPAWWLLPMVVVGLLAMSLWRAARTRP
jgi:hypothetical protein